MTRFCFEILTATLIAALVLPGSYPALAGVSRQTENQTAFNSQAQISFEGLGLILEGRALMQQYTSEAYLAALTKFKKAFALSQGINDKMVMGAARFYEGIAYDSLGKSREALNAILDASRYLEDAPFASLYKPMILAATGSAYENLGEMDKALDHLNRALPLLKQMGVPQFTAYALKRLGDINVKIGRKRVALEHLNEGLSLSRETGDWLQEIQVLSLMSALKSSLGQSTEALDLARAAVDRAKENGSRDLEGYGYFTVGAAYAARGNLDAAVEAYNRALALLEGSNDGSGKATALNNIGLIYVSRGDFDRALNCFERALKLAKSSEDPISTAYTTNNIGTVYQRRGEGFTALHYFEEALAIARRVPDKRLESVVLSNLAPVYFSADSRDHAVKLLKDSAQALSELDEPVHALESLISLADGYASMGRYQEALDVLAPVLESRDTAEDPARQGYVLRERGSIYLLMGDREKAMANYELALAKLEAAGDETGRIEVYAGMGAMFCSLGDNAKAEQLFTKAQSLARAAGLRQSEALILSALGGIRDKAGDATQAESHYDAALAIGESLRSSARVEELKTDVSNVSAISFAPAILLKMKLGKTRDAFALTERARARTLLDQINSSHIDVRKGADAELIDQEQNIRFEIRLLDERLKTERRQNPLSEASALIAASIKEKEQQYSALLVRLKASNPQYAELQSYTPTSLSRIQQLLPPGTTLVSYFVTEGKTLAFVIDSSSFKSVEIPVKEKELRAAVEWFRSFASLRDPKPGSLKQLYSWLIAPVRQHLKTGRLIIVPHGVLHYVPFAALIDGEQFFGDDYKISVLPSTSVLPFIRQRRGAGNCRVLAISQSSAEGHPVLSYADKEAEQVAYLYGSRPLRTGSATRTELMKRAKECDIIHIAAHSELNTTSPLFSRIRLAAEGADNGAIEVREIYGMDLTGARLIVLSGCQTQLGKQSKGDDVVGLTRALLYAGASSVIASLWTVDDEATSELMRSFYGHLKRGASNAESLQAAQVETRKKYPNPYYWAAFVLTGDVVK